MPEHWRVIWELSDGVTQDRSEDLEGLDAALFYFERKARELAPQLSWIQIEKV